MRLITATVPSSCTVALLGDTHDGSLGYDKTGVDRLVDKIAGSKNMRWAHVGDVCDAICSDDKRFVFNPDIPVPLQQTKSVVATFRPIAKKGLVMLKGNHDDKLHRIGEFLRDLIAEPLGVPFGGYTCKVQLADKHGPVCKLFLWHGPIRGSVTSNAKDYQQRQANMKARVRLYMENKASDCAVMAMGHCFDEETEILTPTGWKKHQELLPGQKVMTLNRDTGYLEYNTVEQVHRYTDYKELLHCSGKSYDFMVTPEHGLWTCSGLSGSGRANPYKEETAKEAEGKLRIMRCSGLMSPDAPGLPLNDAQIGFLAWLMAEGSLSCDGKGAINSIRIAQSDAPDGRLRALLECVDGSGLNWTMSRRYIAGVEEKCKDGTSVTHNYNAYRVTIDQAREAAAWITQYLSSEKDVHGALWGMNSQQAAVFIRNYMRADGHVYRSDTGQLATTRKSYADLLHGLLVKAGMRGTLSYRESKGQYTISVTKRTEVTVKKERWSRVPYSGVVWCVSVPNGTLVVRRRGKHLITLNTHKLLVVEPAPKLLIEDDGTKLRSRYLPAPLGSESYIEPDSRWYCNTGSYLKSQMLGHDSYAEMAGYDPIELGHIEVDIEDRKIARVRRVVAS